MLKITMATIPLHAQSKASTFAVCWKAGADPERALVRSVQQEQLVDVIEELIINGVDVDAR